MAEEAERGAGRVAGQAGDQVRAVRLCAGQLHLEAGVVELRREVLLRRAFVTRRVDRVEADQLLQELCDVCTQIHTVHP